MTKTAVAYQCDPVGVLLGETLVQEDPLANGDYLLPPDCTMTPPPQCAATERVVYADSGWRVEPLPAPPPTVPASPEPALATEGNKPEVGEHQIAVIVDGQWQLVADYRGMTYWLEDGSQHMIAALDETPPSDALTAPPPLDPIA